MEKLKQFLKMDLWIVILDVIAVNASYYLALLLRFYVGEKFIHGMGIYYDFFTKIAPWYTVAAIVVFFLFHLYGSMWTYAGLNDMNRILGASVTTAALQVILSLLLAGRMPISYYAIGSFVQFLLVVVIRFSYRFIMLEKAKIVKRGEQTIPALIVGSGDLGRKVVHHLEGNTPYRAAVIAGKDSGRKMDGIPVIALSDIPAQIKAKGIQAVYIADKELTKEERETISKAAEGLEMLDFTGQLSNLSGAVPLSALMEIVQGPLTVSIDGTEKEFSSGLDCLMSLDGEYEVLSINAQKIAIRKAKPDDSWMKVYHDQTGQDVSFF